jgi:hypothetical protein
MATSLAFTPAAQLVILLLFIFKLPVDNAILFKVVLDNK